MATYSIPFVGGPMDGEHHTFTTPDSPPLGVKCATVLPGGWVIEQHDYDLVAAEPFYIYKYRGSTEISVVSPNI